MVLQLTDITSKITDEELLEFTSEYYIPFTLRLVVPAANASIAEFSVGKVGVYTRFFEFANQRVPLSLFLCDILNYYRLHISQLHCIGTAKITNFEVNCRLLAINPTIHLFRAFYHTSWSNGWVSFSKRAGHLQCYTEKLDALRRWREIFFWVDNALFPWGFAFYTKESLPRDERPTPGSYSVEDAELINENHVPINAYSEAFLCHMGLSRNYFHSPEELPTFISDDGREMDLFSMVHLSKPKLVTEGVRPLRDGEEPLLEATAGRTMELVLEQPEDENTVVLEPTPLREAMDASPTTAAKDVTETPPLNVEAASNTTAPVMHVEQSLPKASPFTTDNLSQGGRETRPKVFEGMPADQLMEEIDMVAAHQAALVAQLKARFSGECSRSVQKDEEIVLLKAQLADARVKAESARSITHKLAEEKMSLLVQLDQERASSADHRASCHWVVKYLEGAKNNHFARLEEFHQGVEERWLISHGLRLASMCTLESQEVKQSFGNVVKCVLARGRVEAVEELHENKLLTVPAAQVPGYNKDAYEELVVAMEKMKLLELPHIAQLEHDQDYPIDVIMAGLTLARHDTEGAEAQSDFFLKPDVAQLQVPMFARPRDILNPFALEKEIP
nr:transposase (putative), gypsy type [Tanacetum cinerariifolium]